MNFYKHHLGDYDGATSHLSWDEDQAYSRLLRVYYRTEKPIPPDTGEACRLTRARTTPQRHAVEAVLREFFDLRDDGWHNKRADEEIASARLEGEDSKLKKENEAERQRRHRERRKALFARLRELGEVPKWDTSSDDLQRLLTTVQQRNGHVPVTPPVTRTATANHKPLAMSHEPEKRVEATRGSRLPPDWRPSELLSAWAGKERPDLDVDVVVAKFRDYWAAKPGKGALKLDWDMTFRNWVREEKPGRQPIQQRIKVDL